MAAALILLTMFSPAAGAQEANELSFYGGRTSMNAKALSSSSGSQLTSIGAAYGVSWLRAASSFVRLGLDVGFLKPRARSTNEVTEKARVATDIDSVSMLGVVRLGPSEGDFRPHFSLGLGAHQTSISLEVTPSPGYVWVDSGTDETRSLLSSGGLGIAAKLQGGADYAYNDTLQAGAFVAYHLLGTATYAVSPAGKAMGLGDARGSMSAVSYGLRLSASF